jgi:hypothetical protein
MQDHRTAGELPESPANPAPPIGNVHGLGESHALRVDLRPVQVPWFADEVGTLQELISDELAVARSRHDQAGTSVDRATVAEVDRRIYQLRVLAMVRRQLPLTAAVVAACVRDPWLPDDRALEAARITASLTVVAPARSMLVLIRGAARNVADALGEALRGPTSAGSSETASTDCLRHWPEFGRMTPAVAQRLVDMAAAAQAFADTYAKAVALHAYTFDPEHYPIYPDDLW